MHVAPEIELSYEPMSCARQQIVTKSERDSNGQLRTGEWARGVHVAPEIELEAVVLVPRHRNGLPRFVVTVIRTRERHLEPALLARTRAGWAWASLAGPVGSAVVVVILDLFGRLRRRRRRRRRRMIDAAPPVHNRRTPTIGWGLFDNEGCFVGHSLWTNPAGGRGHHDLDLDVEVGDKPASQQEHGSLHRLAVLRWREGTTKAFHHHSVWNLLGRPKFEARSIFPSGTLGPQEQVTTWIPGVDQCVARSAVQRAEDLACN